MAVTIRRGEPRDATAIAEFNRRMAWETEHKHLDPNVLARGVGRVFADPARGFYLIAEADGEVVGQLMVTFEWSDWRDGWFWWVQSVYVRADARGRGVYRTLYEHVRERARAAGDVIGLRLYVEKDNHAARETYHRLGMEAIHFDLMQELLRPLETTS